MHLYQNLFTLSIFVYVSNRLRFKIILWHNFSTVLHNFLWYYTFFHYKNSFRDILEWKLVFFITRQKLVKTNKYEVQRRARAQGLHYIHCSTNKRFPSNRIASLMMRGKKACFMHTKSYYGWLNAKYANGKFFQEATQCFISWNFEMKYTLTEIHKY